MVQMIQARFTAAHIHMSACEISMGSIFLGALPPRHNAKLMKGH